MGHAIGDLVGKLVGYVALILAIILFASIGVGVYYRGRAVSAEAQVKTLQAEAKLAAAALKTQRKLHAKTTTQAAYTAERVASAVEANPEWASQPVPQEIQDALR